MSAAPLLASEGAEAAPDMTQRMMMLMIQLGLMVFAARLGCMLFQRLQLPGVLGELAAGMLIGPYLLGGIAAFGFPQGLFPLGESFPLSPELYGVCTLASIVLLFVAGLETDLKLFLRYSLTGSLVGIGGVVFSFIAGDLTAVLFSRMIFGQQLGFFAAPCLFLGVLSTATSVGITARVLSDKHKLDSPEGVTILAGAVVDDVLGIVMLAIVLGIIAASTATGAIDWAYIGTLAAKAIGIWLAATVIGLVFARRISSLLKWFRDKTAIAVTALGLALLVAGFFEEAGLAMIIGGYVTGLALSRTDISRLIMERLDPVYRLMVPIFFCAMGMLVDFRALGSWPIIAFGLVYTLIATAAKIAGCSLPALCCGFNRRGALRIGMGMVPRGEVALIIAGIGLASVTLDTHSFGVAVMMTALTTVAAPVLLIRLFEGGRGTRRELPTGSESAVRYEFPTSEIADLMISKINAAFAAEGFYIHSLEHDKHDLYQFRQNDIVITLYRDETAIVFRCNQSDEHLVGAAVYEVLGDFRQMVNELNKPFDQKALERRIATDGEKRSGRTIDLSKYISSDLIIPRLAGDDKEAVISELLDRLVARGLAPERDSILHALLNREKVVSTGMEHGVAIPHAKCDKIEQIVCAVGIKPEGLDFDSIDGLPARIFILELAPSKATGPHLQFMSTISQVLDHATCKRLAEMEADPAAIRAVLIGED
jgi:Kef-type K+ transport system membrane component KefB/mannitol/fructose-specific phosphotransferase system IIA component (Ntr-type)